MRSIAAVVMTVAVVACSAADMINEPVRIAAGQDGGALADAATAADALPSDADARPDDVEAEAPDAGSYDAGADADRAEVGQNADAASDAPVDAPYDAGYDATADAPADAPADVPDAVTVADAPTDVAADSPGTCSQGAARCDPSTYEHQTCDSNGGWIWDIGDQSCCTNPARFMRNGFWVTDLSTGLVWLGNPATGQITFATCSNLSSTFGAPLRFPTLSELTGIVIGEAQTVGGRTFSVCSPSVDHAAFLARTDLMWTSDWSSCVDFNTGRVIANCVPNGALCVKQ